MLNCDPGSGIWRGLGGGPWRKEGGSHFFLVAPQPHPQAPFPRQPPTFLPALFYHLYVLYVIIIVIIFMFYIIVCVLVIDLSTFLHSEKTSYNKNKLSCSNQCMSSIKKQKCEA